MQLISSLNLSNYNLQLNGGLKYGECSQLCELQMHVIAYLSLSMSLTFLFARHCLIIMRRVEALETVRPPENRLSRGRRRTRHRLPFRS